MSYVAKSPSKPSPRNASNSSRKPNCGKCKGCLHAECGVCQACRDKPKCGGPGKLKKACMNPQCDLALRMDKTAGGVARRTRSSSRSRNCSISPKKFSSESMAYETKRGQPKGKKSKTALNKAGNPVSTHSGSNIGQHKTYMGMSVDTSKACVVEVEKTSDSIEYSVGGKRSQSLTRYSDDQTCEPQEFEMKDSGNVNQNKYYSASEACYSEKVKKYSKKGKSEEQYRNGQNIYRSKKSAMLNSSDSNCDDDLPSQTRHKRGRTRYRSRREGLSCISDDSDVEQERKMSRLGHKHYRHHVKRRRKEKVQVEVYDTSDASGDDSDHEEGASACTDDDISTEYECRECGVTFDSIAKLEFHYVCHFKSLDKYHAFLNSRRISTNSFETEKVNVENDDVNSSDDTVDCVDTVEMIKRKSVHFNFKEDTQSIKSSFSKNSRETRVSQNMFESSVPKTEKKKTSKSPEKVQNEEVQETSNQVTYFRLEGVSFKSSCSKVEKKLIESCQKQQLTICLNRIETEYFINRTTSKTKTENVIRKHCNLPSNNVMSWNDGDHITISSDSDEGLTADNLVAKDKAGNKRQLNGSGETEDSDIDVPNSQESDMDVPNNREGSIKYNKPKNILNSRCNSNKSCVKTRKISSFGIDYRTVSPETKPNNRKRTDSAKTVKIDLSKHNMGETESRTKNDKRSRSVDTRSRKKQKDFQVVKEDLISWSNEFERKMMLKDIYDDLQKEQTDIDRQEQANLKRKTNNHPKTERRKLAAVKKLNKHKKCNLNKRQNEQNNNSEKDENENILNSDVERSEEGCDKSKKVEIRKKTKSGKDKFKKKILSIKVTSHSNFLKKGNHRKSKQAKLKDTIKLRKTVTELSEDESSKIQTGRNGSTETVKPIANMTKDSVYFNQNVISEQQMLVPISEKRTSPQSLKPLTSSDKSPVMENKYEKEVCDTDNAQLKSDIVKKAKQNTNSKTNTVHENETIEKTIAVEETVNMNFQNLRQKTKTRIAVENVKETEAIKEMEKENLHSEIGENTKKHCKSTQKGSVVQDKMKGNTEANRNETNTSLECVSFKVIENEISDEKKARLKFEKIKKSPNESKHKKITHTNKDDKRNTKVSQTEKTIDCVDKSSDSSGEKLSSKSKTENTNSGSQKTVDEHISEKRSLVLDMDDIEKSEEPASTEQKITLSYNSKTHVKVVSDKDKEYLQIVEENQPDYQVGSTKQCVATVKKDGSTDITDKTSVKNRKSPKQSKHHQSEIGFEKKGSSTLTTTIESGSKQKDSSRKSPDNNSIVVVQSRQDTVDATKQREEIGLTKEVNDKSDSKSKESKTSNHEKYTVDVNLTTNAFETSVDEMKEEKGSGIKSTESKSERKGHKRKHEHATYEISNNEKNVNLIIIKRMVEDKRKSKKSAVSNSKGALESGDIIVKKQEFAGEAEHSSQKAKKKKNEVITGSVKEQTGSEMELTQNVEQTEHSDQENINLRILKKKLFDKSRNTSTIPDSVTEPKGVRQDLESVKRIGRTKESDRKTRSDMSKQENGEVNEKKEKYELKKRRKNSRVNIESKKAQKGRETEQHDVRQHKNVVQIVINQNNEDDKFDMNQEKEVEQIDMPHNTLVEQRKHHRKEVENFDRIQQKGEEQIVKESCDKSEGKTVEQIVKIQNNSENEKVKPCNSDIILNKCNERPGKFHLKKKGKSVDSQQKFENSVKGHTCESQHRAYKKKTAARNKGNTTYSKIENSVDEVDGDQLSFDNKLLLSSFIGGSVLQIGDGTNKAIILHETHVNRVHGQGEGKLVIDKGKILMSSFIGVELDDNSINTSSFRELKNTSTNDDVNKLVNVKSSFIEGVKDNDEEYKDIKVSGDEENTSTVGDSGEGKPSIENSSVQTSFIGEGVVLEDYGDRDKESEVTEDKKDTNLICGNGEGKFVRNSNSLLANCMDVVVDLEDTTVNKLCNLSVHETLENSACLTGEGRLAEKGTEMLASLGGCCDTIMKDNTFCSDEYNENTAGDLEEAKPVVEDTELLLSVMKRDGLTDDDVTGKDNASPADRTNKSTVDDMEEANLAVEGLLSSYLEGNVKFKDDDVINKENASQDGRNNKSTLDNSKEAKVAVEGLLSSFIGGEIELEGDAINKDNALPYEETNKSWVDDIKGTSSVVDDKCVLLSFMGGDVELDTDSAFHGRNGNNVDEAYESPLALDNKLLLSSFTDVDIEDDDSCVEEETEQTGPIFPVTFEEVRNFGIELSDNDSVESEVMDEAFVHFSQALKPGDGTSIFECLMLANSEDKDSHLDYPEHFDNIVTFETASEKDSGFISPIRNSKYFLDKMKQPSPRKSLTMVVEKLSQRLSPGRSRDIQTPTTMAQQSSVKLTHEESAKAPIDSNVSDQPGSECMGNTKKTDNPCCREKVKQDDHTAAIHSFQGVGSSADAVELSKVDCETESKDESGSLNTIGAKDIDKTESIYEAFSSSKQLMTHDSWPNEQTKSSIVPVNVNCNTLNMLGEDQIYYSRVNMFDEIGVGTGCDVACTVEVVVGDVEKPSPTKNVIEQGDSKTLPTRKRVKKAKDSKVKEPSKKRKMEGKNLELLPDLDKKGFLSFIPSESIDDPFSGELDEKPAVLFTDAEVLVLAEPVDYTSAVDAFKQNLERQKMEPVTCTTLMYQCEICKRRYKSMNNLQDHWIDMEHWNDNLEPITTMFYHCAYCLGKYVNQSRMFEHESSCKPESGLLCTHCGLLFTDSNALRQHGCLKAFVAEESSGDGMAPEINDESVVDIDNFTAVEDKKQNIDSTEAEKHANILIESREVKPDECKMETERIKTMAEEEKLVYEQNNNIYETDMSEKVTENKHRSEKHHKSKQKKQKGKQSCIKESLDTKVTSHQSKVKCPYCDKNIKARKFDHHETKCGKRDMISKSISKGNHNSEENKNLAETASMDLNEDTPEQFVEKSQIHDNHLIESELSAQTNCHRIKPEVKIVLQKVKMSSFTLNGMKFKFCGSVRSPCWKIKQVVLDKKSESFVSSNAKLTGEAIDSFGGTGEVGEPDYCSFLQSCCSESQHYQREPTNAGNEDLKDDHISSKLRQELAHGAKRNIWKDLEDSQESTPIIAKAKASKEKRNYSVEVVTSEKSNKFKDSPRKKGMLKVKIKRNNSDTSPLLTEFEKALLHTKETKKKDKLSKDKSKKLKLLSRQVSSDSDPVVEPSRNTSVKHKETHADIVDKTQPFFLSKTAQKIYFDDKKRKEQSQNFDDGLPDFSSNPITLESLPPLYVSNKTKENETELLSLKLKDTKQMLKDGVLSIFSPFSSVYSPAKSNDHGNSQSLKKLKKDLESLGIMSSPHMKLKDLIYSRSFSSTFTPLKRQRTGDDNIDIGLRPLKIPKFTTLSKEANTEFQSDSFDNGLSVDKSFPSSTGLSTSLSASSNALVYSSPFNFASPTYMGASSISQNSSFSSSYGKTMSNNQTILYGSKNLTNNSSENGAALPSIFLSSVDRLRNPEDSSAIVFAGLKSPPVVEDRPHSSVVEDRQHSDLSNKREVRIVGHELESDFKTPLKSNQFTLNSTSRQISSTPAFAMSKYTLKLGMKLNPLTDGCNISSLSSIHDNTPEQKDVEIKSKPRRRITRFEIPEVSLAEDKTCPGELNSVVKGCHEMNQSHQDIRVKFTTNGKFDKNSSPGTRLNILDKDKLPGTGLIRLNKNNSLESGLVILSKNNSTGTGLVILDKNNCPGTGLVRMDADTISLNYEDSLDGYSAVREYGKDSLDNSDSLTERSSSAGDSYDDVLLKQSMATSDVLDDVLSMREDLESVTGADDVNTMDSLNDDDEQKIQIGKTDVNMAVVNLIKQDTERENTDALSSESGEINENAKFESGDNHRLVVDDGLDLDTDNEIDDKSDSDNKCMINDNTNFGNHDENVNSRKHAFDDDDKDSTINEETGSIMSDNESICSKGSKTSVKANSSCTKASSTVDVDLEEDMCCEDDILELYASDENASFLGDDSPVEEPLVSRPSSPCSTLLERQSSTSEGEVKEKELEEKFKTKKNQISPRDMDIESADSPSNMVGQKIETNVPRSAVVESHQQQPPVFQQQQQQQKARWFPPGYCFRFLSDRPCLQKPCPFIHQPPTQDQLLAYIPKLHERFTKGDLIGAINMLRSHTVFRMAIEPSMIYAMFEKCLHKSMVENCYLLIILMKHRQLVFQEVIDDFIHMCSNSAVVEVNHYLWDVFGIAQELNIQPNPPSLTILLWTFSEMKAWRWLWEVMLYCTENEAFTIPQVFVRTALMSVIHNPTFAQQAIMWLYEADLQVLQGLDTEILQSLCGVLKRFNRPDMVTTLQDMLKARNLPSRPSRLSTPPPSPFLNGPSTPKAPYHRVNSVESERPDAPPDGHIQTIRILEPYRGGKNPREGSEGPAIVASPYKEEAQDGIMLVKNILSVAFTKCWDYLADLYIDRSMRHCPIEGHYIEKFVVVMSKNTDKALKDFLYHVMTKYDQKLKENVSATLDRDGLSFIGNALFRFSYDNDLWSQGYEILYTMKEYGLLMLNPNSSMHSDIAAHALEACIQADECYFALDILDVIDVSNADSDVMCEMLQSFQHLIDKLLKEGSLKECYKVIEQAFKLLFSGNQPLDHNKRPFALPSICSTVIGKSLMVCDVETAVGVYKLFIQHCQPFPIVPALKRALLVAMCDNRLPEDRSTSNLYEQLKKDKVYPAQSLEYPRMIVLQKFYTPTEVFLVVNDYIQCLYNMFCDRIMEDNSLQPQDLQLKVSVNTQTSFQKDVHVKLPYLNEEVTQSVIQKVLQCQFEPPLQSILSVLDMSLLVQPQSLHDYIKALDQKMRRQGLHFRPKKTAVRGRGTARRGQRFMGPQRM